MVRQRADTKPFHEIWRPAVALLACALLAPIAAGSAMTGEVIDVRGSACEHGPVEQPGGRFLVYVFCDSALGSNLGIVLSRLAPGADPIGTWSPGRRFWQEEPWATDITSIAWDPFSDRLFVATSEVYGDGGVFALDLVNRAQERIFSVTDIDPQQLQEKADEVRAESYFGFIEELNADERSVTVSIRLIGDGRSTIAGTRTMPLSP